MYKYLLLIFFAASGLFRAQTSEKPRLIRIVQAESFSFDRAQTDAQVLKGKVICEHEGTFLHCDTAYFYEKANRILATGNILILKGDSIRVTGEKLEYDGKSRLATLRNNVRCVEREMVLTTNLLTFDVKRSIANYYNGGTIVHRENTLVSRNGHYYSSGKEAAFHYDVVLTNPNYKMTCDTLKYRIPNKTAYFLGPTLITAKTDYIYCENGWYDTEKEKAQFSRNALLVTSQQRLRGDSMTYDRNNKTGRAYNNVTLTDTAQKSVLYGHYIEYSELRSEALVTRQPLYVRIVEKDSLFLAADTLYHIDIDSVDNFLNAYHNVKIYKKDLQAVCDSATLNTHDSLMQLFRAPILWTERMQASSKHMKVEIGKNRVKGFLLEGRAFLIQMLDSQKTERFNQLTGRTIAGTIVLDTVRKVKARGNAEILYYPKSRNKITGLNRTTADEVDMWFRKGEASRISLRPATEGRIDPLRDLSPDALQLKGFNWSPELRPASRYHLHAKQAAKK